MERPRGIFCPGTWSFHWFSNYVTGMNRKWFTSGNSFQCFLLFKDAISFQDLKLSDTTYWSIAYKYLSNNIPILVLASRISIIWWVGLVWLKLSFIRLKIGSGRFMFGFKQEPIILKSVCNLVFNESNQLHEQNNQPKYLSPSSLYSLQPSYTRSKERTFPTRMYIANLKVQYTF